MIEKLLNEISLCESELHKVKNELASVNKIKKDIEADIDKARGLIKQELIKRLEEDGDLTPVRTKIGSVYLTEKRDAVIIEDEDAVPDDFVKIKRMPDKVKIKKHLEDNNRPDWARFDEPQMQLNIRKK